mmetsp:Transcript_33052/g.102047  ORF Transcript_33052/g.102047 Transcript_33052/m.102047 type:complete len:1489 (-) Transcript_33052:37-4503(-)
MAPFLAGAADVKDDAIATTSLDALDKLMSHAVVTPAHRIPADVIPSSARVRGKTPPPQRPSPQSAAATDEEGAAAGDASPTSASVSTPPAASTAADDTVPVLRCIVEAAASRSNAQSEEVTIHVIRTLLTSVAACDAHGDTLALAVATMVRILMTTRGSKHTQQTGKASLSQIAGIVQRRTEVCVVPTDGESEPEAWVDCVALLRTFTDLTRGSDIPRISLGITLLHNCLITLDAASVRNSPSAVDHLRRHVTTAVLPLLVNTTPALSKAAFYLLQHLLEKFFPLLSRELPPILNLLYAISERSSSYTIRSHAYATLVAVAKQSQLIFDVFRSYDCEVGRPNVIAQLCERLSNFVCAVAPPQTGMLPDESLRLQAVAGIAGIASAIRRFHEGRAAQSSLLSPITATPPRGAPSSNSFAGRQPSEQLAASETDEEPTSPDLTYSELVQQLERKRRYQAVLDTFRADPAKGITAAIEEGMCKSNEPADIAAFLRIRGLDKVKVGEYLAKNKDNIKAVEEAFIRLNDFTGLTLDQAIRKLMGFYKIAGEAQVVDRAMQCVSKQYCEQNPDVFKDVDTAYVLSFSIMMLNTDQHSPNVKEKMTVDQFCGNNRGIDSGSDLPREYLEGVYKRIRDDEIRLNDDTITLEDEEVLKATQAKAAGEQLLWDPMPCVNKTIERVAALTPFEPMKRARDPKIAVLAFNAAWPHAHTALQKPFGETTNATRLVIKCLEAMDRYVGVACALGNSAARRAVVTLLKECAQVTVPGTEMVTVKNIHCVSTLIHIATRDGDHLDDSWGDVLACISCTTRIAASLKALAAGRKEGKLPKPQQACLDVITTHLDVALIDALFAAAPKTLSDTALLALIDGLLATALREFRESPPRVSAFIQLVEIFSQSTQRPEAVLRALWSTLASTAADIAVNLPKVSEAVFKVIGKLLDGLVGDHVAVVNQAAITNGESQAEGAETAEVGPSPQTTTWAVWQCEALDVMWRAVWQTRDPAVRGHVLSSVTNVIVKGATHTRAGWASLLRLLNCLARDVDAGLVVRAYFTFVACIPHIGLWPEDAFAAAIATATCFAASGNRDVESGALEVHEALAAVARYGAPDAAEDAKAKQLLEASEYSQFAVAMGASHDGEPIRNARVGVWDSLVGSVASLIASSSPGVRLRCVETLFRIVTTYPEVWTSLRHPDDDESVAPWVVVVTGAVLPLFDNLYFQLDDPRLQGKLPDDHVNVLRVALSATTALFAAHIDALRPLLPDVVEVVSRAVNHRQPVVSNVGFGQLRDWISRADALSGDFDESLWALVAKVAVAGVRDAAAGLNKTVLARAQQSIDLIRIAVANNSKLLAQYDTIVLPVLSNAFTSCGDPVGVADARLVRTLIDFSCQCAATANAVVAAAAARSLEQEWARKVISAYSEAIDRSSSAVSDEAKAISSLRAAALADTVAELLRTHETSSDEDLGVFMTALRGELCNLIKCCEPRISGPLSALFCRHMGLS